MTCSRFVCGDCVYIFLDKEWQKGIVTHISYDGTTVVVATKNIDDLHCSPHDLWFKKPRGRIRRLREKKRW